MIPGAPDSDGMWGAALELPEQIVEGCRAARALPTPTADRVTSVLALGMGGSGIGNDVLAAIAGPALPVPVVVGKDYELPAFVGPSTLVFAASFSGNTEETLTATGAALERGAQIVAITSGGKLATMVDAVIPVPRTIPHPRAAIGAMAVAPLVVLESMGLLAGAGAQIDAAVRQLEARRGKLDGAAEIARRIGRTIPLFYGGGALGRAAALRWKCQVNENPKSPAFASANPELCHNELTGWGQMGDITRQLFTIVDLRHDFEHPQVRRRFDLVDEILDEVVADVIEVRAVGDGPLAQLFDLVMQGDIVALMLAGREGIDPGPIPILEDLKTALSGG